MIWNICTGLKAQFFQSDTPQQSGNSLKQKSEVIILTLFFSLWWNRAV